MHQTDELLFQESYFGKTKILLECEKVLDQMVLLYKVNPTVDMINHPLNLQFRKLLQKQFGFKEVYINWYRTNTLVPAMSPHVNAFTYVSAFLMWDPSMRVNFSTQEIGRGYYDTKHQNVLAVEVSYMMPLLSKCTGGELLAIILHEIGHNFDRTPYFYFGEVLRNITIFQNWLLIGSQWKEYLAGRRDSAFLEIFKKNVMITLMGTISGTSPFKRFYQLVNSAIGKLFDIVPFASAIEHNGLNLIRIRKELLSIDPRLFAQTLYATGLAVTKFPLMIPAKWVSVIPVKKKEIYADSFAQAYGYGPELSSALQKADSAEWREVKDFTEEFPVLAFFADLRLANMYVTQVIWDPDHGTSIERSQKMLDNLKEESRNPNLPPELREELKNDITEVENRLHTYMQKTREEKLYISAAMQWFLVNICGGNSFFLERLCPDYRA